MFREKKDLFLCQCLKGYLPPFALSDLSRDVEALSNGERFIGSSLDRLHKSLSRLFHNNTIFDE